MAKKTIDPFSDDLLDLGVDDTTPTLDPFSDDLLEPTAVTPKRLIPIAEREAAEARAADERSRKAGLSTVADVQRRAAVMDEVAAAYGAAHKGSVLGGLNPFGTPAEMAIQRYEGRHGPITEADKRAAKAYGEPQDIQAASITPTPIRWGITAMETPARPVRTLLGTGDVGRSLESIYNPDVAMTPADLRRKLGFADAPHDAGMLRRGQDMGLDFAIGTATDPTMLLHPGLTKLGEARQLAARELIAAGEIPKAPMGLPPAALQAGEEAWAARKLAAENKFTEISGAPAPQPPPANWKGTAATLGERLKANETGLSLHVPLTKIEMPLTQLNKAMGVVADAGGKLAGIANEYTRDLPVVRETKRLVEWSLGYFKNPTIYDAQGQLTRANENFAQREAEAIMHKQIQPVLKGLEDAGVPEDKWRLAGDLMQGYDPELAEPTLRPHDIRAEINQETLRGLHERVANEIQSLPVDQRTALMAASEGLHRANIAARERLGQLGVKNPMLGSDLRKALLDARDELAATEDAIGKRGGSGGASGLNALPAPESSPGGGGRLLEPPVLKDPPSVIRGQLPAPVKPPIVTPPVTDSTVAGMYTRRQWTADLQKVMGLPAEHAAAVTKVTDALAETWGKTYGRHPADWYGEKLAGVKQASDEAMGMRRGLPGDGVRPSLRAGVAFDPSGRAIIHAFTAPDVDTVIHELGHIMRRSLSASDQGVIAHWIRDTHGIDFKGWLPEIQQAERDQVARGGIPFDPDVHNNARGAEELYAEGFQRFMRDGSAPTKALVPVFAKMKQWLTDIWQRIVIVLGPGGDDLGQIKMTPEIREHFARMLGGDTAVTEDLKQALGHPANRMNPLTLAEELKKAGMTDAEIVQRVPELRAQKYSDGQIIEMARDGRIRQPQEVNPATLRNPRTVGEPKPATDGVLKLGGGDNPEAGLQLNPARVEALANPTDETFAGTVKEYGFDKTKSIDATAPERQSLLMAAQKLTEAKTAQQAWDALMTLPTNAAGNSPAKIHVDRLGKLLGINAGKRGTLKSIMAHFPGELEVSMPRMRPTASLDKSVMGDEALGATRAAPGTESLPASEGGYSSVERAAMDAEEGIGAEDSFRSVPPPPPDGVARVPFMVTRDMERQLYDLGYSRKDVSTMLPADATEIISAGRTKVRTKVSPVGDASKLEVSSAATAETGRPIKVTAHHGTDAEFENHAAELRGTTTKARSARVADFFTLDPRVAEGYARDAKYLRSTPEVDALRKEMRGLESMGVIRDPQRWSELNTKVHEIESSLLNNDAGNIRTTTLSADNPLVIDIQRTPLKQWRGEHGSFSETLQWAKENGYDSVIYKNAFEGGMAAGQPIFADHIAVFDTAPVQIGGGARTLLEDDIRSALQSGSKRVTFDFSDPVAKAHFESLGGKVKDPYTGVITDSMRKKFADVDPGGELYQTRPIDPDLQELIERRDEQRAAVKTLEGKVGAIPNYFPGVVDAEVVADYVKAKKGGGPASASTNALTKSRSFVFGEGPLEGVPMTTTEATREVLKGGGTRATDYTDPRGTVNFKQVFKAIAADAKDGLDVIRGKTTAAGLAELKAAAEDSSAFFTTNPVDAYTKYFSRPYASAIRSTLLERDMAATFNAIPVDVWEKLRTAAREGTPFDEIEANISRIAGKPKAEITPNGMKLEDLIPEKLKQGRSLREALIEADGPFGWRKLDDFNGGAHYVPADVARRYENYVKYSTSKLGEALKFMAPALRVWKASQTGIWPDFHIRNQLGDSLRMVQGDLLDARSVGDYTKLLRPKNGAGTLMEGFGDFSQWKDVMFDLGEGGTKQFGSRYVGGDRFLKAVADHGGINTGQMQQLLLDGAENAAKNIQPGAWSTLKRSLAYREDVNRIAGFATRLRAGDSLLEAGLRVEDALFNFSRSSPAANMLRRTGIAPFIGWFAKNIPYQIEWAFHNPGQFAAALRLADMVQGEGIPDALLPKYARDKYNVILRQENDARGKPRWVYVTNQGMIPLTDLTDLVRGGVKDEVLKQLGPLPKTMTGWLYGDEDRSQLDQMSQNLLGKPARVVSSALNNGSVNPYTGEVVEAEDTLLGVISPLKVRTLDIAGGIRRAQGAAERDLSKAKGELHRLLANRNSAQLLPQVREDPASLNWINAEIEKAQAKVKEMQAAYAEQSKQNLHVMERVRALQRVE